MCVCERGFWSGEKSFIRDVFVGGTNGAWDEDDNDVGFMTKASGCMCPHISLPYPSTTSSEEDEQLEIFSHPSGFFNDTCTHLPLELRYPEEFRIREGRSRGCVR